MEQISDNEKIKAYKQLQYAFEQIENLMNDVIIEEYAKQYGLCQHILLINSTDNLTKSITLQQAPLALPMIHGVMSNLSSMESIASFILFCDGIEKDKQDKNKFQRMLQVIVYHRKFTYVRSYFINKIEEEEKGFYVDQTQYYEDWKKLDEKVFEFYNPFGNKPVEGLNKEDLEQTTKTIREQFKKHILRSRTKRNIQNKKQAVKLGSDGNIDIEDITNQ